MDRAAWEQTAREVSGAFRRFPGVEDGQMFLRAERQTQRFLNSEGAWDRTGTTLLDVALRASARTADGTPLSDVRHFYGRRAADLPRQTKLVSAAEDLARSLTQLAAAGKTEEYSGPVLFTGEAAAVFFDRLLADKLTDPALPVTEGARGGAIPAGGQADGTARVGRSFPPASRWWTTRPLPRLRTSSSRRLSGR